MQKPISFMVLLCACATADNEIQNILSEGNDQAAKNTHDTIGSLAWIMALEGQTKLHNTPAKDHQTDCLDRRKHEIRKVVDGTKRISCERGWREYHTRTNNTHSVPVPSVDLTFSFGEQSFVFFIFMLNLSYFIKFQSVFSSGLCLRSFSEYKTAVATSWWYGFPPPCSVLRMFLCWSRSYF